MKRVKVSWSNVVAGVFLVYVGAYCYSNPAPGRHSGSWQLPVSIQSTSREGGRDPNAVRFYCRNNWFFTVRDLSFAHMTHQRIKIPPGCDYIRFRVEAIGDALGYEAWTSDLIYIEPNDSLDIRINPILAGTYFMIIPTGG